MVMEFIRFFQQSRGAQVVGIDISEASLQIAQERARKAGVEKYVSFQKMDAEAMDFPDNTFDVVLDGGSFSSLDVQKVFPELARVVKKNGIVVGIETLGHNPFANLNRKIHKIRGKRTEWATQHIFTLEDVAEAKKYFGSVEVHFFHLFSWIAIPFLGLPGGKILLRCAEKIEAPFLAIPFLQRYAFKVVFIFSEPKDH